MAEETFECDRCGRTWPKRQLKEVMYEEGKQRTKRNLCPECLDEVMNAAGQVRGIAGDEKRAAIHITEAPGEGDRQSFGERES